MKQKIILLFSISFIFSCQLRSQVENMVINPSFEKYKTCPGDYTYMDKSHKLIPGWTYPSFTTPDYFNECSSGQARVPDNFAGYSLAKTGKGYMGAILTGTDRDFREYIQGSLKEPMKEGQVYCVSFWYKLASGSKFAVDQLSLYFVNQPVANGNTTYLNYNAQLKNTKGLFLDNTDEWEQFCQLYTAKGGETNFIVGNFRNYDNTNYVVTGKDTRNKRGKAYAYYFFDDFEIRPLIDCNVCACVPQGMETVVIDSSFTGGLNPITGRLDEVKNDGKISLGISGGTPPYRITWSNGAKNVKKIENLASGTYTYKVADQNNCRSQGTIVFKKPIPPDDPFTDGLKNIEEGTALILDNIFFETGKSTLLPTSYKALDQIVDFFRESSVSLIEISGHTDSQGSDSFNEKLSQNRAQEVVNYIVGKGISNECIKAKGYGESRPIDTNKTPEGMAKNRRVEFLVLKK